MTQDPATTQLGGLTPSEVAIMELLVQGMPNLRIAKCLGITEANVMYGAISIYKKLKVVNRTEATRVWQKIKADANKRGPL